jgi:hypothetical protein|tara:strand:- start:169 stop:462 length:294 start_codon:yes stop_codon:yes gene_type:complete
MGIIVSDPYTLNNGIELQRHYVGIESIRVEKVSPGSEYYNVRVFIYGYTSKEAQGDNKDALYKNEIGDQLSSPLTEDLYTFSFNLLKRFYPNHENAI